MSILIHQFIIVGLTDESNAARYICQYMASQEDSYAIGKSFEAPKDVRHGQVAANKLWDTDVLHVHILNPEELARLDLNQQNILDWADKWKRLREDVIPQFRLTGDADKAEIRVLIGE